MRLSEVTHNSNMLNNFNYYNLPSMLTYVLSFPSTAKMEMKNKHILQLKNCITKENKQQSIVIFQKNNTFVTIY